VILALVAPRSGGFPGAMRSPRSATSSRATPRAGIKTALSFCAEPRASGPDRRCSRADANGVWFASQRFRHSRIVAEADAEAAVWVDADLTLAPDGGCRISPAPPPSSERGARMSRSKAFGNGSETNQSPRNGPLRAAADICDSFDEEQAPVELRTRRLLLRPRRARPGRSGTRSQPREGDTLDAVPRERGRARAERSNGRRHRFADSPALGSCGDRLMLACASDCESAGVVVRHDCWTSNPRLCVACVKTPLSSARQHCARRCRTSPWTPRSIRTRILRERPTSG
jgi:hypothetical protein